MANNAPAETSIWMIYFSKMKVYVYVTTIYECIYQLNLTSHLAYYFHFLSDIYIYVVQWIMQLY